MLLYLLVYSKYVQNSRSSSTFYCHNSAYELSAWLIQNISMMKDGNPVPAADILVKKCDLCKTIIRQCYYRAVIVNSHPDSMNLTNLLVAIGHKSELRYKVLTFFERLAIDWFSGSHAKSVNCNLPLKLISCAPITFIKHFWLFNFRLIIEYHYLYSANQHGGSIIGLFWVFKPCQFLWRLMESSFIYFPLGKILCAYV